METSKSKVEGGRSEWADEDGVRGQGIGGEGHASAGKRNIR